MNWRDLEDDVGASCLAEFGEELLLVVDEDEFPITGIFDRDATEVAPDGTLISTNQPVAKIRIADLPGAVPQVLTGQEIIQVAEHRSYVVVDVQEDGKGWARLVLEKT